MEKSSKAVTRLIQVYIRTHYQESKITETFGGRDILSGGQYLRPLCKVGEQTISVNLLAILMTSESVTTTEALY